MNEEVHMDEAFQGEAVKNQTSEGRFKGNPDRTAPPALITSKNNEIKKLRLGLYAMTFACVSLIMLNIALFPLKKTEIAFVKFPTEDERTVILRPGELSQSDRAVMIEDTLEKYVINHETINVATKQERDNWLRLHTETAWYKFYLETTNPNDSKTGNGKFRAKGMVRDIEIYNISYDPAAPNKVQVYYSATDRRGNNVTNKQEWVANFIYSVKTLKLKEHEKKINMTGVVVGPFTVSKSLRAK